MTARAPSGATTIRVPPETDLEDPGLATQRAILERPTVSIRARIAAGFVLLFLFMAAITGAAVVFVSGVTQKMHFLERAGSYLFEIQQARRFEKNFFLYGTNLEDALANIHTAESELDRIAEQPRPVISDQRYHSILDGLTAYEDLLYELRSYRMTEPAQQGPDQRLIEAKLRKAGARILSDAEEMNDQERLAMHAMLRTSMVGAVGFLVLMVFVLALIAVLLSRAVVAPLERFVDYAKRIGTGDYSPVTPHRRFRDEFSDLAVAFNTMLRQLQEHQEQLLQAGKMAAVGTLTSGIAHELNNPLNNIGLTTEALIENMDEYSRETKLTMLNQIDTQVERACATVRNLLDFTRKDQPVFTAVSIHEALRSTLNLLGNELSLGQIDLKLELADDLPEVAANPRHLQQLFLNLLLNAIDAMPDGGPLTVRTLRDESGGVRVDIADSGVGIPQENLDRIFDPFFTTKEPGRGTGLGLSVSFGIVEQHGGRITVQSRPGKGATFSVFLPAAKIHRPEERNRT
jgi:two-component system NtrC family sensor kinase